MNKPKECPKCHRGNVYIMDDTRMCVQCFNRLRNKPRNMGWRLAYTDNGRPTKRLNYWHQKGEDNE